MLDIVSMLFTLIRTYIPSEIRWSYLMDLYDMFAWNICISTLLYCVFFALWCDDAPACCSPPCAPEPFLCRRDNCYLEPVHTLRECSCSRSAHTAGAQSQVAPGLLSLLWHTSVHPAAHSPCCAAQCRQRPLAWPI